MSSVAKCSAQGHRLPETEANHRTQAHVMNILLIGGGGREHALAWALSASPLLTKLYCAPGNAGINDLAASVDLDVTDHDAVISFCKREDVSFVIVGPEAPLVAGLADDVRAAGIKCFGPSAPAAQLEGSKAFTKELCSEANIPTAAYGRFKDAEKAKAYAADQPLPIVIKADGLAAGKGVVIAETQEEAAVAIDACFEGAFGDAGHEIVIEEFMLGEEASFFALVDGEFALPLATAQDHKRVGDGDTGANTGGMGAYSPAPVMTDALNERVMSEIIMPTVKAMAARGMPFTGILYAGLIITDDGPKLIEYNVRFGDPECQVLMMRLRSDLLPALLATCEGKLATAELGWHEDVALTVVMAADGYPDAPKKGTIIKGVEAASALHNVEVFHAGTKEFEGTLFANGGRVLNVTARGNTVAEAQTRAYEAIGLIDWPDGFCRRDIGWRAIVREGSE
jgi:phosphoribosylamine---glycine ligase